ILTGAEVKKDMLSVLKNGLGATRNNIKAQGLSVMSYFAKKTPEQMQLPGMGTSGTKTSMFAGLLTSFQGMIGKFKS
ncbi:hypothetical protein, partial [Fusobacterium necrophorum]